MRSRRPAPDRRAATSLGVPSTLANRRRISSRSKTVGRRCGRLAAVMFSKAMSSRPGTLLVEKYQCVERLVLCECSDVPVPGEVIEEGDDLRLTHVLWVALVVKQDEALGPAEVGLRGAEAVVLATNEVAHLPEQLGSTDDLVRIRGEV